MTFILSRRPRINFWVQYIRVNVAIVRFVVGSWVTCSQLWRSCLARHVYTMRDIHLYGWHSTWHQSWLMSPRWRRETAISHRYVSP